MIESHMGTYSIDGTPCRTLIERAIARGWAKKPKTVIARGEVQEKKVEALPAPLPIPTPKVVQPMTLEDRAKAAGMTVDQFLDMRMRNRERTHHGDAQ